MKTTRVILAIIFWLAFANQVLANDDVQFCQSLKDFAKQANKSYPAKADAVTENIQIVVNCATKVVFYIKRLLIDHNDFQNGWRRRQLLKHHQLHCNKVGLASQSGWTVRTQTQKANFNHLITLETNPEDCNITSERIPATVHLFG
jgi:hypothetical protein